MQAQSYFQLTGPLIMLVLSIGFAVIWRFTRDEMPLRLFALAFFLGACGSFVDYMRDSMPFAVALHALNLLYMATGLVFISALFRFYAQRLPWGLIVPAFLVWSALLSWFILVDNSVYARIIVMNMGTVTLIGCAAVMLNSRMIRPIDRVLQVTLVVIAFCIGARAGFVILFGGDHLTNENYSNSMIALSLHFTLSFSALALSIVLFIMVGMEIVNRLTRAGETDALSGVFNRRGFESRIEALAPSVMPHAVVMADIDGFKKINDRHGHEAGDMVIRRFARILSGTARDADLVVRWGGEEFLVIVADADISTARLYAEAVRTAFAQLEHDCLDGEAVTASFGIAPWHRGSAVATVAHLADKALYRAKREGRNRVCVSTPDAPGEPSQRAVA